jgi:hypothetical protein
MCARPNVKPALSGYPSSQRWISVLCKETCNFFYFFIVCIYVKMVRFEEDNREHTIEI